MIRLVAILLTVTLCAYPPRAHSVKLCDYCGEYPAAVKYDIWLCEWCEMHLVPPLKD
jgi:hypothetical protein